MRSWALGEKRTGETTCEIICADEIITICASSHQVPSSLETGEASPPHVAGKPDPPRPPVMPSATSSMASRYSQRFKGAHDNIDKH